MKTTLHSYRMCTKASRWCCGMSATVVIMDEMPSMWHMVEFTVCYVAKRLLLPPTSPHTFVRCAVVSRALVRHTIVMPICACPATFQLQHHSAVWRWCMPLYNIDCCGSCNRPHQNTETHLPHFLYTDMSETPRSPCRIGTPLH